MLCSWLKNKKRGRNEENGVPAGTVKNNNKVQPQQQRAREWKMKVVVAVVVVVIIIVAAESPMR